MAEHDLATVAGTIEALRDWRKDLPPIWHRNPLIDAAVLHLSVLHAAAVEAGTLYCHIPLHADAVDADTLYRQLTPLADPNCRNCDGRGVFYGNVAICDCVLSKIPKE